jgi:hypothetical protein
MNLNYDQHLRAGGNVILAKDFDETIDKLQHMPVIAKYQILFILLEMMCWRAPGYQYKPFLLSR